MLGSAPLLPMLAAALAACVEPTGSADAARDGDWCAPVVLDPSSGRWVGVCRSLS